jgi:uncharacterized membrane protein YgdD (TMEM256/DUF423 family)
VKTFVMIASILGATSVGAGAFGAHALRDKLTPRMLDVWQTAAHYQMYHALALLAVAWIMHQAPLSRSAMAAGWAFIAGVALFSGSLYAMALSGIRDLGAITPLGGVALIIGWICLAAAATRLPD